LNELKQSGDASVDVRLGRWFLHLRYRNTPVLDIGKQETQQAHLNLTKTYFVAFDDNFVLHPGNFVLGATLEWIKLPPCLGGYITGKSSWGRRGLIIETAAGVHPNFTGCLTLEIANVGEIPIMIRPGMKIAQLFLHRTKPSEANESGSNFAWRRRPTLGEIRRDATAERLARRLWSEE
jgi:dCTP deaminase